METLALFDLAFRRNEWLAERQSLIAANVANANTPGYRARDLSKFEQVLDRGLPMASTNPSHMVPAGRENSKPEITTTGSSNRLISGNNVNLDSEFLKSGEVMRNFSLTSQVIKTFHRMIIASAKV